MATIDTLNVKITSDVSGLQNGLQKAASGLKGLRGVASGVKSSLNSAFSGSGSSVGALTSVLGSAGGSASSLAAALGPAGVAIAGVAAVAGAGAVAIRKLGLTADETIPLYEAQIMAETKLATIMRQRMNASDEMIDSIKELTSAQQQLGVIGDEVQIAGAQQLSTFLNQGQSLQTLIPAMNNLIAQQKGVNATQQDATNIGNLFGKVMQGQTAALTRVGITFNEAQEQILKYGTEEQKAATLAQVVTDNVGDMNRAIASTPTGRLHQLSNTMGDIREKFGEAATNIRTLFLPVMEKLAGWLDKIADGAVKATNALLSIFGIEKAATDTTQVWGNMSDDIDDTADSADELTKSLKEVNNQIGGFDELHIISPDSDTSGIGSINPGDTSAGTVSSSDWGTSKLVHTWNDLNGEMKESGKKLKDLKDGAGDAANALDDACKSAKELSEEINSIPDIDISWKDHFDWGYDLNATEHYKLLLPKPTVPEIPDQIIDASWNIPDPSVPEIPDQNVDVTWNVPQPSVSEIPDQEIEAKWEIPYPNIQKPDEQEIDTKWMIAPFLPIDIPPQKIDAEFDKSEIDEQIRELELKWQELANAKFQPGADLSQIEQEMGELERQLDELYNKKYGVNVDVGIEGLEDLKVKMQGVHQKAQELSQQSINLNTTITGSESVISELTTIATAGQSLTSQPIDVSVSTNGTEQTHSSLQGVARVATLIPTALSILMEITNAATSISDISAVDQAIRNLPHEHRINISESGASTVNQQVGMLGESLGTVPNHANKASNALKGLAAITLGGLMGILTGIPVPLIGATEKAETFASTLDALNGRKVAINYEERWSTVGGSSGGSSSTTAASYSAMTAADIPALASGGVLKSGQLFVANEQTGNPELVGQQNGRSVVMNNAQIVDAVSSGVAAALQPLVDSIQSGGGEQTVKIRGNDLIYTLSRTQKQRGAAISNNFGFGGA